MNHPALADVLASIPPHTAAAAVDPVALVDLAARAFSIVADFSATACTNQPWTQHLAACSALVGGVYVCMRVNASASVVCVCGGGGVCWDAAR